MANIREIQSRINSVKDTMKITNAMYMISSSKLTQARKKLADTEPYFYALQGEDQSVFYVIYRNYIIVISTRGKTFRQRNVRLDRSLSRQTRDWPVHTITIL